MKSLLKRNIDISSLCSPSISTSSIKDYSPQDLLLNDYDHLHMKLSTTYDKYLLFTTKSKQISELSQKHDFNVTTGVIRYADREFDNVNNI